MRISFCLMSNKPHEMIKFAEHFAFGMTPGNEYELCLSHEEFDMDVLHRINLLLPEGVGFVVGCRPPVAEFSYTKGRMKSFELSRGPDYIVIVDDDLEMELRDGYTTGERYLDSFRYLEEHRDCGVVYHKSFVSDEYRPPIAPMWKGFFETGYGMVMRGNPRIGVDYLVPGIGADIALGVCCLEDGRYLARADNTPGRHISQRHSKNWFSPGTPMKQGAYAAIERRWGTYYMGGSLPKELINESRNVSSQTHR